MEDEVDFVTVKFVTADGFISLSGDDKTVVCTNKQTTNKVLRIFRLFTKQIHQVMEIANTT